MADDSDLFSIIVSRKRRGWVFLFVTFCLAALATGSYPTAVRGWKLLVAYAIGSYPTAVRGWKLPVADAIG